MADESKDVNLSGEEIDSALPEDESKPAKRGRSRKRKTETVAEIAIEKPAKRKKAAQATEGSNDLMNRYRLLLVFKLCLTRISCFFI